MLTCAELNIVLVILILSGVIWFNYKSRGSLFLNRELIPLPVWLRCLIPQKNCATVVDIDGWSVVHLLLYFVLGVFVPNHYLLVVTGSVAFEALERSLGERPRWIIDPATNLLGYTLGSMLSKRLRPQLTGYDFNSKKLTAVLLVIAVLLILYMRLSLRKE